MPLKAVISDLGGVLVHVEDPAKREKWERLFGVAEGGLPEVVFGSEMSRRALLGQATTADVWRDLAERFNLTHEELAAFRQDFWEAERLNLRWLDFLRSLRPRYKVAILSNAWPDTRDAVTRYLGLDTEVDLMVISAEEGIAKPNPAIYALTVRRLGVRFDEAVFVDDLEENVLVARQLGMAGVLFRHTDEAIAEVRRYLDEAR